MAWSKFTWADNVTKAVASHFTNIEEGIEEAPRGLHYNEDAQRNIAIGTTLSALTTGYGLAAYGPLALGNVTTAFDSTAIGDRALENLTTGPYCTAVGRSALGTLTTALDTGGMGDGFNTAVGSYAGYHFTGSHSTLIGAAVLDLGNPSSGRENVAIGPFCMRQKLEVGEGNVAVGCGTMEFAAGASNGNVTIGQNALCRHTTGSDNIVIGRYAGASVFVETGLTSGSDNVLLGRETGVKMGAGTGNVCIGYVAGNSCAGNENVYVGYWAGSSCTTGSKNIIIGLYQGAGATTMTGSLVISNGPALGEAWIRGAESGKKLGFFGVEPVVRQKPAAGEAALRTALTNLGLIE